MATTADQHGPPPAGLPRRLLVGVTGSVAVLALPMYLNALRMAGTTDVTLVMTPSAEKFIPAATMRHICDLVCTEADPGPGHVNLARRADGILVLPATAHLIGCAAAGLAPNLVSTVLLAATRPVTFVPAMNPRMWQSAPVRRNVRQLRDDGHRVIEPVPGTVYEVASRQLCSGLVVPPPEQLIEELVDAAPRPERR